TRTGSLSGAVAQLIADRADRAKSAPGSAVEALAGGMSTLVDALAADLVDLGGVIRTGAAVTALDRTGDGWVVSFTLADTDPDRDELEGENEPELEPEIIAADAVIIATTESDARALLGEQIDLGATPEAPHIEIVSLL